MSKKRHGLVKLRKQIFSFLMKIKCRISLVALQCPAFFRAQRQQFLTELQVRLQNSLQFNTRFIHSQVTSIIQR